MPTQPSSPDGVDRRCDANTEGTGSAQLSWDEHGLPVSNQFGDFYFSRANGLEETGYVFLQHNQLPQRWQALKPDQAFVIAETGFGTGLNFLTCWQSWNQQPASTARLHFISVERYPLTTAQLTRALALWPQLAELAEQLLQQYPIIANGIHRLRFDHDRISLTLIFDDACHGLKNLNGQHVDAWFLDGFSPEKNPQMWTQALFSEIACSSAADATFSTFTAASSVRRALQSSGFTVERARGFGKKREMLYGLVHNKQATETLPTQQPNGLSTQLWFDRPISSRSDPNIPICVIGAGLAGASTAFALAQRGCKVELFERGSEPGCGASGNPQGVLYAKLPAVPTLHSRTHLSGYLYSLRILQQQLTAGQQWSPCGVLQLALDDKQQAKNDALLSQGHYPNNLVLGVNPQQASQLAGYPLTQGGLFYPGAGWVSPAKLCQQLLEHPNIVCHFNQPVDSIEYQPAQQRWTLLNTQRQQIATATILVVANAHEAKQFPQLAQLPLKPIRGQTTSVAANSIPELKTVLCGNGYIAPANNQRFCFGASFDLHNHDSNISPSDHRHNLELVEQVCPPLASQLEPQLPAAQGRVGFRCAASDYLPIVGAVPDHDEFISAYAPLGKDAKAVIDTPPSHLRGLFVNLGHGSKGLITAPLAGELLADLILGEPLAVEHKLAQALNPARFIIKKLIKGAI